jgi:adenosylmethionine-8-amino-7-oxononanoate aminotransferase
MGHVFHRDARASYPVAVGGDGPYLVDRDGKRYLDASGGAAVSCLGHSHARVVEAIQRQAARLAYAHTSFFTNEPMEALADRLVADAPGELERVYFVTGGSEAVEAALKLARQYFLERGEPQRRHFVARRQSYHGNTLGALAVGGNAWRRTQFEPMLMDVAHIAPCYAYRDRRADESEAAYGERVANELEAAIVRLGADSVIAFVAETVVGATAGAVTPVSGYFKRVREICDRYGVLLILDEVMCGMGRTGTLHACEQEGIAPDLLCIAKGLGAGYQPIGALMVSRRVFEAVRDGSGFFQHGHTYLGHPVACAAALAVQDAIRDEGLLDAVKRNGRALRTALEARFGDHPHVGDLRGRGLFMGVELVRERADKTPFDPALRLHAAVKREAMARGLMCYPMGGTIDGRLGDHVLLAPPFIIEGPHIEEIVAKLGAAIDAALARTVPR